MGQQKRQWGELCGNLQSLRQLRAQVIQQVTQLIRRFDLSWRIKDVPNSHYKVLNGVNFKFYAYDSRPYIHGWCAC